MKNKKQLYKKCLDLAKTVAKERDWYTCQWCGSKSNIQWSHIINEARDHRLAIDSENIIALCYHCHLWLWHKDPILAAKRFNSKFPWKYNKLQKQHIKNGTLWSISILFYEEQLEKLNQELLKFKQPLKWRFEKQRTTKAHK